MEYKDQLKYIKSHQKHHSSGKRGKKNRKDRTPVNNEGTIGLFGKFIWLIQLAASVFMIVSLIILGILPVKYMVIILVITILFLLYTRAVQKRKARYRDKRMTGRGVSVLLSIIMIVSGIYSLKVNAALDTIAVGEESGGYEEEHGIDVTTEPFNVYISGIDVYGDIDQESRSDVNLIATVNPNTHKILLTTTPRDYYVTIPGISGDQRDKLTHAGIYGIDKSIATLENLYNTTIPFYVRVNFTSVEEIVDVLGGVEVESELAFTTGKESGAIVEVKEGTNYFNGEEALAFVRERKALPTGDNQRGKNQQALLTGLIQEVMSPKIILHANSIINSIAGNADTNMSEKQIKSLIRMQLNDMEGWEIESIAATGDDSGMQYCYSYSGGPLYVTIPDENSVADISQEIMETLSE